MGDLTAIAWTDHTWNPWMGCTKVSQGCRNCYADTLTSGRMNLDVFGAPHKRKRTSVQVWNRPIRWNREALAARRPARVFCSSLADVFEDAPGPNEWRPEVFAIMRQCPWLDFQILTKRPENIARMLPDSWGADGWPNVWLGTSIEDNRVAERAEILTRAPAVVHFISYEPAIGPLDAVSLEGVEWMIVGGESGPGYRRMDLGWAFAMQHRCQLEGVAYFFKQDAAPRTEMGIDALGEIYRDYPAGWDRYESHAQERWLGNSLQTTGRSSTG